MELTLALHPVDEVQDVLARAITDEETRGW